MVSNTIMVCKLYFKILLTVIMIIRVTKFICFIYVTILFNTKSNSALVLKYHGEIMVWCPEGDYSAIKQAWCKTHLQAL